MALEREEIVVEAEDASDKSNTLDPFAQLEKQENFSLFSL